MKEDKKNRFGFLGFVTPKFDELSLFSMSLTCVLLLLVQAPSFIGEVSICLHRTDDCINTWLVVAFLFGVPLIGFALSFRHVFTDRPKTGIEKSFMLFFAIFLNGFSGIMSGVYVLGKETNPWFMLFPVVNILNGIFLFGYLPHKTVIGELWGATQRITHNKISDKNATRAEIVFATIMIVGLFAVCHFLFELFWLQTLSVCLIFANNLCHQTSEIVLRMRQFTL